MKGDPSNTARRGRPRRSREQAESDRRLIIESARALFAAGGYDGVSMRRIASMARCSPATLYNLFRNKRQLLRHIWEEVFSELVEELERCYAASPESGRLEALCLTFIDFWLNRPDDYRAIFLIEDRLQNAGDSYFVDSSRVLPRLSILRRAIHEAQKRGELPPGDPEEMQNVVLCGLQGVAFNLITIPEYPWGDPARLKRNTVRALIRGLG